MIVPVSTVVTERSASTRYSPPSDEASSSAMVPTHSRPAASQAPSLVRVPLRSLSIGTSSGDRLAVQHVQPVRKPDDGSATRPRQRQAHQPRNELRRVPTGRGVVAVHAMPGDVDPEQAWRQHPSADPRRAPRGPRRRRRTQSADSHSWSIDSSAFGRRSIRVFRSAGMAGSVATMRAVRVWSDLSTTRARIRSGGVALSSAITAGGRSDRALEDKGVRPRLDGGLSPLSSSCTLSTTTFMPRHRSRRVRSQSRSPCRAQQPPPRRAAPSARPRAATSRRRPDHRAEGGLEQPAHAFRET